MQLILVNGAGRVDRLSPMKTVVICGLRARGENLLMGH